MKKLSVLLATLLFTIPLMGQNSSVEDLYDPFADYSDFIESSNEETDLIFFKFGRLLSVGATLGYKTFTGTQTKAYDSGPTFGAFFTYYMGLQFAFQLSFLSSTHDFFVDIPSENSNIEGTIRFNNFSLHGKYFLNTQNLTKSISRFNPFFIAGVSQYSREYNQARESSFSSKESSITFDLGVGGEYLFNNNKNFITVQGTFYKTNFPDQNKEITIIGTNDEDVSTGIKIKGDIFNLSVMAGFNF